MADQSKEIQAVSAAKQAYDKRVADLEQRLRVDKEVAKAPVLLAINAALAAGVPQNRIAVKGMGYAGIAPLKSFLGATGTTREAIMSAVSAQVPEELIVPVEPEEVWEPNIPNPFPINQVIVIEGPEGNGLTYALSSDWESMLPTAHNAQEEAVNQLIFDATKDRVKYAAIEVEKYGRN